MIRPPPVVSPCFVTSELRTATVSTTAIRHTHHRFARRRRAPPPPPPPPPRKIKKALRLRPPAWAFDREVQRDVTLPGGLELRRREILLLSPFAQAGGSVCHRLPKS